jgi:catechol 2,3-dioxygenase-like lactoylglutathione lyase family enzyme
LAALVTARTEGFDHITIVVTDLHEARRFFGLLGFEERIAVVASGQRVADYMGIPGWESDHVTLVLTGAEMHQEIQLLFFHQPPIVVDDGAGTLDRTGFNHVCFRVNDLAAMLEHLAANGITPRN